MARKFTPTIPSNPINRPSFSGGSQGIETFPSGWSPGGGEFSSGGFGIHQQGSRRFCGIIADGDENLYLLILKI